jgi:hypothetical protein
MTGRIEVGVCCGVCEGCTRYDKDGCKSEEMRKFNIPKWMKKTHKN